MLSANAFNSKKTTILLYSKKWFRKSSRKYGSKSKLNKQNCAHILLIRNYLLFICYQNQEVDQEQIPLKFFKILLRPFLVCKNPNKLSGYSFKTFLAPKMSQVFIVAELSYSPLLHIYIVV